MHFNSSNVLRSAFGVRITSNYFLLGRARMLLAPSVRFLSEAAGLLLSLPPPESIGLVSQPCNPTAWRAVTEVLQSFS